MTDALKAGAAAVMANEQEGQQLDVALATIRRLNRRCQTAEAALNMRVEQFQQRSKDAIRNHYFDRGREAERIRIFPPPTDLERASEAVIAALSAAVDPRVPELCNLARWIEKTFDLGADRSQVADPAIIARTEIYAGILARIVELKERA